MAAAMSTVDPIFEHSEFANWYKLFKKLTPRTRVLEAPEDFREYLLADGIRLHEERGSDSSDSEWESLDVVAKEIQEISDESNEAKAQEKPGAAALSQDSTDGDESAAELRAPPAAFHDLIERTITELGGEVAPKLNWSAPVDAKWMLMSNSMRCTNANDIYLLLKSSDYINHDLKLEPRTLTLVLREWFDLHPSTEFRCFVRNGKLVGISQRDMNYYEFLDSSRPEILKLSADIVALISAKYPDPSFVCDLHIPISASRKPERAWLIDINPWHEQTDPILFLWDELSALGDLETPQLRLVEKVDRSRTFAAKPHSASQVPYDFVDMPTSTLEDMLKQLRGHAAQEKN